MNVDFQYDLISSMDRMKQKQMENKKKKLKSLIRKEYKPRNPQDDALKQITQNYNKKMKTFPKVDAYQRLKGYLQLQDQEIKRVRNNISQPTIGMLYPQSDEDSRLSAFLVGQSPMRRNYNNNRYVSESPARHIQNQSIPNLQDYLKDRNIRQFVHQSVKKKEFLESQIQELEAKKFKLYDFTQDPRSLSMHQSLSEQVPKFLPQKMDPVISLTKQALEKAAKSSEELPMSYLKDKLLTANIQSTNEIYSSINPLQLQLYSVTDTILQYHETKCRKYIFLEKHNQSMMKALQKSDHNRRQTLFHKHLLYNRPSRSISSQKEQYDIQKELSENLQMRINYNEKLAKQFHKLIASLREGQTELNEDDLGVLQDLRYIILKGRNLNDEDFIELLKLRNFCINNTALNMIINYLFPKSRTRILEAYDRNI